MKYNKLKQSDLAADAEMSIKGGIHHTPYAVVETPIVFVYKDRYVDDEVCKSLGYDVCELQYNGGVIVANKGDFAFGHYNHHNNGWMTRFVNCFLDWLKSKGLNATYESNDILVDGYKVCGICTTRYGRIDYTAGFISVNCNLDHIKAICRKPMNKVPKGLSEYGITTEEVEAMFLAFCEQ